MTTLRPGLNQATQALGNVLNETPPLRAYAHAAAKLGADGQATALLDELQRVQSDVRARQSNGGVTEADLVRLRQLQQVVQSNPTIAAFIEAQQNAQAYLPEVNQAISELLGVNFAALGRASVCC